MENESEIFIIEKPKARLKVFLWLSFYIPVLLFLVFILSCGLCPPALAFGCVFKMPVLPWTVIYVVGSYFYINRTVKNVYKYNGKPITEKDYNKVNRHISLSIVLGIINPLINAIFLAILTFKVIDGLGFHGFTLDSFLCTSIGNTGLIGLMFYIFWYHSFCHWTRHISVNSKHIILGITAKNVLVASVTTISMLMLALAPIFLPKNQNISPLEFYRTRMLRQLVSGLIYLGVDFFLLTKQLSKNLKIINAYTHKLGEGDYSEKVLDTLSRDEMGLLCNAVNSFKSASMGLLSGIKSTVDTTNISASATKDAMKNISDSTSQIAANIGDVKSSTHAQGVVVEKAYNTTKDIIENIDNLTNNIQNQTAAVEESAAAVRQMVSNINSVTNILEKNSDQVKKLAASANIGQEKVRVAVNMSDLILKESAGLMEASSVITNIAEQTNLLAMNAAIEAAHAGEAGKGFAVVADEIRKLAEQSNSQGKKITDSLQGLEEVIQKVFSSTKELQQQFNEIFEYTNNVQQQEDVVMNAMKEQNEGSTQILEAINSMNDITADVKTGSKEMHSRSNAIMEQMTEVGECTRTISKTVLEVVNGVDEIISAVDTGNEAMIKTSSAVTLLDQEMGKFILTSDESEN